MGSGGISLDVQNSRIYLRGNTYPAKDKIKAAGGHWDADERAWWVGKAKLTAAQEIAGAVSTSSAPQKPESLSDETAIRGKAAYKGKSGYLILWIGTTSRGEAVKLAFRDGSKVFWADKADVVVEKTYQDREWRGRTEPGMTFGRLNRLRDEYAAAKKDGLEACHKCSSIHRDTDRVCYMCGCTKCDGATGGLCEDD